MADRDSTRTGTDISATKASGLPNKGELHALDNLPLLIKNVMRSKTILKTLSSLSDKGLIDFDPMEGKAELTDAGRAARRQSRQ